MVAALLAALFGCSATEPEAPRQGAPNLGWISEVALRPQGFSDLMDRTGREGWVALHAHDDARATSSFGADPILRTRPALKVSSLEQDLADVAGEAHHRLFTEWEARGELPSGAGAIAAWSARCSGRPHRTWLDGLEPGEPGSEIAAYLDGGPDTWPAPTTPITQRMVAHHAALNTDPMAPWDRPGEAVLVVEGEVSRQWRDPCFHQVAATHARHVAAPAGWADAATRWSGLDATLFAPWLTPLVDLESEPSTWGADSAAFHGLTDAPGLPGSRDDGQAAREQSRVLEERLQKQVSALEELADPNGKALLVELRLGEHWRQQWHLAMARVALRADRPRQALAYAELGTDFSLGPGPGNPPALYAVRANALLRLGRAREALDALHALRDQRGVAELAEVVGDLVVLQGLDRTGDSKEL